MRKDKFIKGILPIILILALSACAGALPQKGAESFAPKVGSGQEQTRANLLAREAIDSVRRGDLTKASRVVNAALRFEPENPHLHFLNGYVYHLLAVKGDPAQRDFAETGYLLALNIAPDHPYASYFLGRLYLDGKRWREAQERFAQALWVDNTQNEAYMGLAIASYYARDLPAAGWATQKGLDYQPTDAGLLRAAVMVAAASGDQENAHSLLERYRNVAQNQRQYAALERRVKQWGEVHEQQPIIFAEAAGQQDVDAWLNDDLPHKGTQAAAKPKTDNAAIVPLATEVLTDWRDCKTSQQGQSGSSDGFSGSGSGSSVSSGGSSGDDTAVLPSLPSPCNGKPLPKMAIIDATILRTEDINSSDNGLNLLNNLSLVFNGSSVDSNVTGGPVPTDGTGTPLQQIRTLTRSFGLPSAGITYALNLFNATDMRAEVLARPSLVALDRMPSQFFSGSTVSIALQGQNGGSGSVVDKPVGVSLSITPTFINQESMLLAVKASRSFIEAGATAGTFSEQMQTSRNAVTANVMINFGQTLVLSGLSERENTENSSGVPGVKDLPVLQYLFGAKNKRDYTKSVVILLTPRRPVTGNDIPPVITSKEQARTEKVRDLLQKTGFKPQPNLDAIFRQMSRNPFYREFRTNDLVSEDWRRETYTERLLNDFATMLFY